MDSKTNTYKSIHIYTDTVMLTLNIFCKEGHRLKKQKLKHWIYSHGYTQPDVAKTLHMKTRTFKRKLSRNEFFNAEQICRLIYLLGAYDAFFVIYFPKIEERRRVYQETFGKMLKERNRST